MSVKYLIPSNGQANPSMPNDDLKLFRKINQHYLHYMCITVYQNHGPILPIYVVHLHRRLMQPSNICPTS